VSSSLSKILEVCCEPHALSQVESHPSPDGRKAKVKRQGLEGRPKSERVIRWWSLLTVLRREKRVRSRHAAGRGAPVTVATSSSRKDGGDLGCTVRTSHRSSKPETMTAPDYSSVDYRPPLTKPYASGRPEIPGAIERT
jgi:hypothetical protein